MAQRVHLGLLLGEQQVYLDSGLLVRQTWWRGKCADLTYMCTARGRASSYCCQQERYFGLGIWQCFLQPDVDGPTVFCGNVKREPRNLASHNFCPGGKDPMHTGRGLH